MFGYYVVSVGWRGRGVLTVLYQNREQNRSFHSLCHRASQAYTCRVVSICIVFFLENLRFRLYFSTFSINLFCLDICYLSIFTSSNAQG